MSASRAPLHSPPPPLTGKQSLLCCGGCLLLLFLFTSTLSISFLSVLVTTASYPTFHCPPFISTHSPLASFSASGVLAVTRSIASFMRVRSTLLYLASHIIFLNQILPIVFTITVWDGELFTVNSLLPHLKLHSPTITYLVTWKTK